MTEKYVDIAVIEETPLHPYWCDECHGKAAFTVPGCEIDHEEGCSRSGEDAMAIYKAAKYYCIRTGETIK